ncbi:hypothetical protein JCM8547_005621 [Rhodosporidiobolus lusitaniae]
MVKESEFDPSRPFLCPECGSRYTRQEHLDRHVTAKHRVAKDFVCPICHKGFARKDILKRHQAGHEKQQQAAAEAALRGDLGDDEDRRSTGSASKPKKKRPVVATTSDAAAEDQGGPVKIARVGRACCRCSKSKLRCDGQNPCERCRKAGIECSFDRPAKGPPSRQGSVSMMMPDELQNTPPIDSDSSATSPENAFGLPALPTPPPNDSWGRQLSNAVQQASMSLYNMPLRHSSPHHAHSLPPNSFIQNAPAPVNYYSGRPPESYGSYARAPSPYRQPPPAFSALNSLHHNPSPLNPYAQPSSLSSLGSLPAAAAASSSSQWDSSAYGRPIGDTENNNVDFFGLVTGNGAADDGIDWSILSGGFTTQDHLFNGSLRSGLTPRDGMSPAPSTSGNVDLGLLTSALTAPAQPVSSLRGSDGDDGPVASTSRPAFEPAEEDENAIDDEEEEDLPANVPIPVRTNSIVESDRAALSLIQLASHTPRVSPEPQPPSAAKPTFPRGHFSVLNPSTEEALRTSHPRDSPSATDPWPLSYRPTEPNEDILPASARGTGYFSRATSPPPHHFSTHLNHVPSVTESTRLRILYKVRELGASDSSLSERFVPRLELLELFVQLYFEKYHALFPLVHKPTWDPNTAPSFLVLAVASVGARYAHERVVGASMHAHALLESARRMAQVMGDADNTLLRTVAWQQTLLIVLQSGIFSGNKRDLERTQAYASMPITYARRQNWLREPKVDESAEELLSLDERWKRWRNREEIRRLGFGALVFDCAGTALWNIESLSLYLDAANSALPCHDALWDASSATAWAALFPNSILPAPSPTLSEAIHLVCTSSPTASKQADSPLASILRDNFALSSILSVLNALGWASGHAKSVEKTFLSAAPPVVAEESKPETTAVKTNGTSQAEEPEDATQKAVENGLEFFQHRILLSPDLLARMEDPSPMSGSLALFVHLTALTQRLPLRVLQPLARTTLAPLPATTTAALHSWSTASNGAVARTTAFHAGQLLALCRSSSPSSPSAASEGPLEPFAIFYAALTLVAFIREGAGAPPPSSSTAFATTAEQDLPQLELDVLADSTAEGSKTLANWLATGTGAAPSLRLFSPLPPAVSSAVADLSSSQSSTSSAHIKPHLSALPQLPGLPPLPSLPSLPLAASSSSGPLRLSSLSATSLILSTCAKRLAGLKVWKVGENLGGVLEALARAERAGAGGGVGGGAGKHEREVSAQESLDGRVKKESVEDGEGGEGGESGQGVVAMED